MNKNRVCIIGAGPSGITALKNLLDEDIDAVIFDQNDEVGGNWLYSPKVTHSSVFETTHIISSKSLSQYEDYTFDDFDPEIPDYPSHEQLAAYFQAYAKNFDLYPRIEFSTRVDRAVRANDGSWAITVTGADGIQRTEHFSHLLVCSGHHWDPRMPKYPGNFDGEMLHSHQFKVAEPFRDKRVLVIGGGNSACDVAVETSRVSEKTSISWRRGYRIIPKFIFGKPSDIVGGRMSWLPVRLRSFMSEFLIKTIVGTNDKYGLQEPEERFGATHPTINDELLYRIRHGKIHPRKDIERFEGKKIVFKDGKEEEYDTIIACTGFRISHPFFEKDFIDYSEGPVPLYLKMFHPEIDNIGFIGLFQPLGCIWPGSELQAKIYARYIKGEWKRPSNIADLCRKEVENPHYRQINTPRHTITVDYHLFRKQLLKQLPVDFIKRKEAETISKS